MDNKVYSDVNRVSDVYGTDLIFRQEKCKSMRKVLRGMNSSCFTLDDVHVILIDTGSSPEHEKKLIAIFEREVGDE
jgi:hypothetical protein